MGDSMHDKLTLTVTAETMPGLVSRARMTRDVLENLGELLTQLGNDPTRDGVLLILHEGGDVSISSKGWGSEAGHA
jgi:hypothetical protein